ncbi:MAG TPA: Ldh family oxidoreductase [Xanthobacteraceae bacterium]
MTSRPESVDISPGELTNFVVAILAAAGVPERSALLVAEGLVAADCEEIESHGVMLLPMYVDRLAAGSVSPTSAGRVVSQRGGAVVIDGENALGQVTAALAVELAVAHAREHALGAVAVRNAFHFGTAGRWASAIARAGCIGMALSNTRPLMPAPGGAERLVGNNPIAIAVPGKDAPIVLDLATSASAMGKIRLAEARGEKLPEGWASDAQGVPTIDPAAAIKGMLLPAAGPKGFGLAVMIDFLCGGLSAGGMGDKVMPLYGDAAVPYDCAHFFLALDVGAFRPPQDFAAAAGAFAQRVRSSRPAAGGGPVMMPGDPAARASARNTTTCHVAAVTAAALRKLAERLKVDVPAALSA